MHASLRSQASVAIDNLTHRRGKFRQFRLIGLGLLMQEWSRASTLEAAAGFSLEQCMIYLNIIIIIIQQTTRKLQIYRMRLTFNVPQHTIKVRLNAFMVQQNGDFEGNKIKLYC